MSKKSNSSEHHVVPNPKGGWDIKRNESKRISGYFDTKKAAVDVARIISRNQHTELVIHKKDGKIERKDSHGNDPYPPKG